MKNSKTIFAFAVLAALASCSNEHVISQADEVATPIRIQANVGAVATKAATTVQNTKFDNGEKVNVYIFENTGDVPEITYKYGVNEDGLVEYKVNNQGELNTELTTTTPQYYPANGHGIDVFGVYPETVKKKETEQNFYVQANQSTEDYYKKSDLMAAYGVRNHKKNNDDIVLNFQHNLSKIIVKLKEGKGFKESLDNATVKIIGTLRGCKITVGPENLGVVKISDIIREDGPQPITVGTWTSGDADNGIAAIVVPQSVSPNADLFEVNLENGITYKYRIPEGNRDVQFDSGKVYTYTLTLTTAKIEVSSYNIKDWEPVPDAAGDAILEYQNSNN